MDNYVHNKRHEKYHEYNVETFLQLDQIVYQNILSNVGFSQYKSIFAHFSTYIERLSALTPQTLHNLKIKSESESEFNATTSNN